MKFYNFIFSISFLLQLVSCKNDSPEKVVDDFYKKQILQYDFRKADSSLLSSEINQMIVSVIKKENNSAEQLKLLGSSDKPELIEGDLFSSNYEGAQSYKIISTEKNQNQAKLNVEFTYQNNKWVDEISLKLENNRWLIADVKYGQSYLQGTLLNSMQEFIAGSEKKVGADKDEHGCIGSAGYVWSELKQNCIRSFELPIQLLNPEQTMSAGLLFSDDLSKAELFLPDGKISLIKIDSNKYKFLVDRKTVGVLNRNKDKWEFFIVGSEEVYKQK
ncbi:MAG: DUF3828 domain-containing protein [Bacteroidia bacterium]